MYWTKHYIYFVGHAGILYIYIIIPFRPCRFHFILLHSDSLPKKRQHLAGYSLFLCPWNEIIKHIIQIVKFVPGFYEKSESCFIISTVLMRSSLDVHAFQLSKHILYFQHLYKLLFDRGQIDHHHARLTIYVIWDLKLFGLVDLRLFRLYLKIIW